MASDVRARGKGDRTGHKPGSRGAFGAIQINLFYDVLQMQRRRASEFYLQSPRIRRAS